MHAWAISMTLIVAPGRSPLDLRPGDAESYTETVTVIADLDDGTYLQAQIAVSNLGLGDGKAACRLLVVPEGGEAWTHATPVDNDGWRFHAQPHPRLVVGSCQAMAGRALVLDFALGGASLHLEVAARLTAVAPPGSSVGDPAADFYTCEILVPWAPAQVRVILPSKTPFASAGRAYADHSRSTMTPAELARSWVRFRGLGAACPSLVLVRTPPAGPSEGWRWWAADSAPVALAPRVRLPQHRGEPVVLAVGGATLTIAPGATLYRHAPLEEYALAGLLRPWIGSPVTTTFRATLTGAPCGPVPGVLELTTVSR